MKKIFNILIFVLAVSFVMGESNASSIKVNKGQPMTYEVTRKGGVPERIEIKIIPFGELLPKIDTVIEENIPAIVGEVEPIKQIPKSVVKTSTSKPNLIESKSKKVITEIEIETEETEETVEVEEMIVEVADETIIIAQKSEREPGTQVAWIIFALIALGVAGIRKSMSKVDSYKNRFNKRNR